MKNFTVRFLLVSFGLASGSVSCDGDKATQFDTLTTTASKIASKCTDTYKDLEGDWDIYVRDQSLKDHMDLNSILNIKHKFSIASVDFFHVGGSALKNMTKNEGWIGHCVGTNYVIVGRYEVNSAGDGCPHDIILSKDDVRTNYNPDPTSDRARNSRKPTDIIQIESRSDHGSYPKKCADHTKAPGHTSTGAVIDTHPGSAHGGQG